MLQSWQTKYASAVPKNLRFWDLIFSCAVKVIFSPGVRSPCYVLNTKRNYVFWLYMRKKGLMQGLNLFSGFKKNKFCNEIPCSSYNELATTELLSSSGNVKAGPNLPETRWGHGMLVINKKVLIIGGWTNGGTNSVLVYNTDDLTRYVYRVEEYQKILSNIVLIT